MTEKENILRAIRETAAENGGTPLGTRAFAQTTGIEPHTWEKYWARFGDAQREAGLEPNTRTPTHDDELINQKVIDLIRKLGKFPNGRELKVERSNDSTFPSVGTFRRRNLGTAELANRIAEYCKERNGFDDVVTICRDVADKTKRKNEDDEGQSVGEVYLFKSGRNFKIGKTKDTVRRGSELRIQLPERLVLIHSIRTDDPSGIEAYWHRRFAEKRLEGEWFDLNATDIKAFKRWRRIV